MKEDTVQLLVLTVFLLLYMIIGAGIFSALEQQNEQKLKIYYNNIFYTFAKDNNLTSSAISHLLKTHRESCLLGVGINQINKWDFAGSFYFTGTVITTIGFGLSAPSTFEGQLFFIFYALIGIPLNILYLNTALQRIVTILSDLVRAGYDKIPKNKFLTPPGPKEFPLGEILVASIVLFFLVMLLLALAFALIEHWTFFEAIYFIIVACTTVGFGDYVPSKTKTSVGHNIHDAYRVSNWFLIAIGLLLLYVVLNLLANFFKNVLSSCIHSCKKMCPCLHNEVEPFDPTSTNARKSAMPSRRTVSRISFRTDADGPDLGSFAAIQVALDKLKDQASNNNIQGSNTELKALTNIEQILKAEYFRVQSRRKSNSAKSRWKRAARKARLLSPKQEASSYGPQDELVAKDSLQIEHANLYEELPGAVVNSRK